MKSSLTDNGISYLFLLIFIAGCTDKKNDKGISSMDLKRGEVISCGPQDGELFGKVSFTASVPRKVQSDFNIAIAQLHSFEYDESEKIFAKIIDQSPECAMAYWGVAMCNFHPLWAPPSASELMKGAKAIEIARSIKNKTRRESDYIEAIAMFYSNPERIDHRTRVLNFEKAMEHIYRTYKEDKEAAVFYALALNSAADPSDKTYSNQKKALSILIPLFNQQPLHPGLAHYIIHNADYPELAELALPAARKYASIAPSSAHAQHMPSHIFTRLGLWDESIRSNLLSVSSARCYAEKAKLKGHWDEELHGIDYLVYAYLQKGQDELARQQVDYMLSIDEVYPPNFKTAYAFAAVPARYFIERKMWNDAAHIEIHRANFSWNDFPWQKAIYHFTRILGSVHTDSIVNANKELIELKVLYDTLQKQKGKSKEAAEVEVQIKTSEAWILFKQGNNDVKALELMSTAANMEDRTEKHPVTPGQVIPARELFGEMLLQMNKPAIALQAFELNLKTHPGCFNSLYDAGMAADKSGNKEKAKSYYNKLLESADLSSSNRKELKIARSFVSN